MQAQTRIHTNTHTLTHSNTRSHTHTHKHTDTHGYAQTRTHIHAHTCTDQTHANTYRHRHTHTQTHTHTHTHRLIPRLHCGRKRNAVQTFSQVICIGYSVHTHSPRLTQIHTHTPAAACPRSLRASASQDKSPDWRGGRRFYERWRSYFSLKWGQKRPGGHTALRPVKRNLDLNAKPMQIGT